MMTMTMMITKLQMKGKKFRNLKSPFMIIHFRPGGPGHEAALEYIDGSTPSAAKHLTLFNTFLSQARSGDANVPGTAGPHRLWKK